MKVTKPIKVDGSNYQPHRCPWSYRNPKNHLTSKGYRDLLEEMFLSEDAQHITCPGCKRSIYLTLKIEGHNRPGMKGPERLTVEEEFGL